MLSVDRVIALFFLCWISLAAPAKSQGEGHFVLAEGGVPQVVIGWDEDDTAANRHAVEELTTALSKVVGAEFQRLPAAEIAPDQAAILIGRPAHQALKALGVETEKLGEDGIVIRTHARRLLLSGAEPRGALYAVYTFLEKEVGCEWFTSTAAVYPTKPSLSVKPQAVVYEPPFAMRDPFYSDLVAHPEWAIKLKRNGQVIGRKAIPESLGGHLEVVGFCHTFYRLIPPSVYFASHPEWFSEINGERTADNAQLCLSNAELRKEIGKQAVKLLQSKPNARMVAVSQNDNFRKCLCDDCKQLERRFGGAGGLMVDFVNEVAATVAKEVPGALVEMLAYQYTQTAPTGIVPADNVIVRLCSVECDSSEELTHQKNQTFIKDLNAWSAITKHLYIWDYTVDFLDAMRLHPNLFQMTRNIQTFAQAGAGGVFAQGYATADQFTDFVGLKAWVAAHLLWDPSEDPDALIDRYLKGYYGAAAPHLRRHLELLDRAIRQRGKLPGFGEPDLSGIDGKVLEESNDLFEAALKAVEGDETFARRVAIERLAIRYAVIIRYLGEKLSGQGEALFATPEKAAAACHAILAEAEALGIDPGRNVGYNLTLRDLLERRKIQCETPIGTVPEECEGLDRWKWVDIQETAMNLHGQKGQYAEMVDDPAASNGRTVRLIGGRGHWIVQMPPPPDEAARTYGIYVVVRSEGEETSGEAFHAGIYNDQTKQTRVGVIAQLSEVQGTEYQTFFLGDHALGPNHTIWLAPKMAVSPEAGLLVDRVFLIHRD